MEEQFIIPPIDTKVSQWMCMENLEEGYGLAIVVQKPEALSFNVVGGGGPPADIKFSLAFHAANVHARDADETRAFPYCHEGFELSLNVRTLTAARVTFPPESASDTRQEIYVGYKMWVPQKLGLEFAETAQRGRFFRFLSFLGVCETGSLSSFLSEEQAA